MRIEAESQVPITPEGQVYRDALRGDCHLHSTWSDGGAPIEAMAATAMAIGHEYMVQTDHSARLTFGVGDKLLGTVAFIALSVQGLLPAWLAVIVVAKDLYVTLGAGILHYSGKLTVALPSFWGKFATLLQIVTVALVLLGFSFSYTLKQGQPEVVAANCAAQPHPGVNWDNCNLSGLRSERADLLGAHARNARMDAAQLASARLAGADLEYTSLNLSNLRAADLSRANLRGVALRGSDLRDATLVEANLSYANLSGARLEGADFSGAILDHTIWIDQQACAAGSVGECRREASRHPGIPD